MEKKKFMRVQKFLILFLILLLSFPLSALAQQQMIKGQVTPILFLSVWTVVHIV